MTSAQCAVYVSGVGPCCLQSGEGPFDNMGFFHTTQTSPGNVELFMRSHEFLTFAWYKMQEYIDCWSGGPRRRIATHRSTDSRDAPTDHCLIENQLIVLTCSSATAGTREGDADDQHEPTTPHGSHRLHDIQAISSSGSPVPTTES